LFPARSPLVYFFFQWLLQLLIEHPPKKEKSCLASRAHRHHPLHPSSLLMKSVSTESGRGELGDVLMG
jgi:hypothetical protein